ncbi:hypothetical protein BV898_06095 [Hypsibius exemplaris]|uniref:Uncharacterized protein n=1 Tax=Hypsibius exemplaris TaxID=2072580 RepID=A0A1W0WX85_HYPEX|nr:hypothetical protein BV898_06095 [Hypsibius exemplaris]
MTTITTANTLPASTSTAPSTSKPTTILPPTISASVPSTTGTTAQFTSKTTAMPPCGATYPTTKASTAGYTYPTKKPTGYRYPTTGKPTYGPYGERYRKTTPRYYRRPSYFSPGCEYPDRRRHCPKLIAEIEEIGIDLCTGKGARSQANQEELKEVRQLCWGTCRCRQALTEKLRYKVQHPNRVPANGQINDPVGIKY